MRRLDPGTQKALQESEEQIRKYVMFGQYLHIVCPSCGQSLTSKHPVASPFSGLIIHAECKDCLKGRKKKK